MFCITILMNGLIFSNSKKTRSVGAYRIAHILRKHHWDVEVIDFFSYWTPAEIKALLASRINNETKFIGFGTLFFSIDDVPTWFFDYIKEKYPHLITIFGSQTAKGINHPSIDYIINGWGEFSIIELFKYLFSNGKQPMYTLDSFGKKTKTIDSNKSYPAYPLTSLMVKYEHRDFIFPIESLTIECSRGCKFKCKFCNFPVLGVKGDYTRSANDFKEQLQDAYDKFGVTKYFVADETFNDYTEKLIKYADVVEQLPFDPYFTGFIRADILISKKEQLEHLSRMNFVSHYYGIESFNYLSAKIVGKGMDSEKIKNGLLEIKDYFHNSGSKKYRGTISLIVGLPHETENSLRSTFQWCQDNWQSEQVNFFVLEIPKSENENMSEFSINYEKYNYHEITNLTNEQEIKIKNFYNDGSLRVSNNFMIWKNDHLDIFRSIDLINEFQQSNYKFGLGSFTLFSTSDLNFKEKQGDPTVYYLDQIIDDYKLKKLNL